ncbi:putative protein of unknown function (DUF4586) [Blattamonas nauphoetae]|uniref:Cilia-and flagella-associated protein 96 n=1 Tax=Blattamonas nauphoetae TaxID=2049346 RepID=A0ABQ9XZI7_9EUKA|nr:putative protein of unknown function (DUF4586) [Blattamonas nauphoetae]
MYSLKKWGTFSEPSKLAVGDPYNPDKDVLKTQRHKGKQFRTAYPHRGRNNDACFDTKIVPIFSRDTYTEPYALDRQKEQERRAGIISDKPFITTYHNPKPAFTGSFTGLFDPNFQYDPPPEEPKLKKGEITHSKRNFITSPGKKGKSGNYHLTIGGTEFGWMPEPFEGYKTERKEVMRERPFVSMSHTSQTFDRSIYTDRDSENDQSQEELLKLMRASHRDRLSTDLSSRKSYAHYSPRSQIRTESGRQRSRDGTVTQRSVDFTTRDSSRPRTERSSGRDSLNRTSRTINSRIIAMRGLRSLSASNRSRSSGRRDFCSTSHSKGTFDRYPTHDDDGIWNTERKEPPPPFPPFIPPSCSRPTFHKFPEYIVDDSRPSPKRSKSDENAVNDDRPPFVSMSHTRHDLQKYPEHSVDPVIKEQRRKDEKTYPPFVSMSHTRGTFEKYPEHYEESGPRRKRMNFFEINHIGEKSNGTTNDPSPRSFTISKPMDDRPTKMGRY